ncbi:MAG: chemotaxis protein CheA [Candidatus Zixiibacteriota bacterium]
MSCCESVIEKLAADLILVDVEDLPALAAIHGTFNQLHEELKDNYNLVPAAINACGNLVEKIILSETNDKDEAIAILKDSISAIQLVIRDGRNESDISFPSGLHLNLLEQEDCKVSNESEHESCGENNCSESDEKDESKKFIIDLSDGDSDLIADFINEALEHCTNAEQLLMDLETGEDKDEKINGIFRAFHTIKGASGFLDLMPLMKVAHECETLLDLGRKGSVQIEGPIADIVFDSIDTLRTLLKGTENALASGTSYDAGDDISTILAELRRILENPEDIPAKPPAYRIGDQLIEMGVVSQKQINEALKKRETPDEKIGETLVKQKMAPAKAVAKALRQQQKSRIEGTSGVAVKDMVKIDTERLDKMIDTIGELVIAESMVGQDEEILAKVSHKVSRNIAHLNKITRELQEMGMSMRLVPVRGTFQKLARAVRDLTHRAGKKVELNLNGEDTEVDRTIIELIGDPLMHMIRNAMDHGIEKPSERIAAGKPETGTVSLSAYHKGGKVYFDIRDDGHGLNKEKIVAKAIERNIIESGKEISDQEIYKLIFMPGFSTADKVSDISGRGVGMDVVKKNIDAMRGSLDIESELGKGTKFSMKLPLTLAIIEGMLVSVAEEKYIIPTLSVVESLSLTKNMINTVIGRGEMINLRGEMLPLLRINRLFGVKDNDQTCENTVVVVENGIRKVGLVVDKLLGQRQTVIKSLGSTFTQQKWISGGAVLSDGNIGLIIDIEGMMQLLDMLPEDQINKYKNNRETRPEPQNTSIMNVPDFSVSDANECMTNENTEVLIEG